MSIVEREHVIVTTDPLESIPTLPSRQDVLRRAAILVQHYGWVDADLGCKEKGFCVLGAVAFAAGIYNGDEGAADDDKIYAEAASYFGHIDVAKEPGCSTADTVIYVFNDALAAVARCDDRSIEKAKSRIVKLLNDMANGATWAEATS